MAWLENTDQISECKKLVIFPVFQPSQKSSLDSIWTQSTLEKPEFVFLASENDFLDWNVYKWPSG